MKVVLKGEKALSQAIRIKMNYNVFYVFYVLFPSFFYILHFAIIG